MSSIAARPRYYSLDAARGFAVLAMVIAHTAPLSRAVAPRAVEYLEFTLAELAAPLFALVMGLTIALTASSAAESLRTRARYRLETVVKAAALIVLGFALEFAYSRVDIVLDYLGATLLAALPFLFLRVRWLLVWTAVFSVCGPLLVSWATSAAATNPGMRYPQTPITVLVDWIALAPHYRILGLLPLVLLGIALGRIMTKRRLPVLALLASSIVVFIATEGWRLADLPGAELDGGYVEVLKDTAMAVGAFVVINWFTDLATPRIRRAFQTTLEPVAVQGRLALSIYALHVLLLIWLYASSAAGPESPIWSGVTRTGWLLQAGVILACWAFAALWWRFLGVGPIERIIGVLTGRHRWGSLWATARRSASGREKPSRHA